MFAKLIFYDLRNGLLRCWKKYLISFFLFNLFYLDLYFKWGNSKLNRSDLSLGDYILYPIAGMKVYIPNAREPFIFPVLWIIIFMLIFYIVLYYPFLDLCGFGKNILVNSRKRSLWWLSKCVWVISSVITYFAIACITAILFSIAANAKSSLNINHTLLMMFGIRDIDLVSSQNNVILAALLLILVAISLCLMQLTISLFIKPLYSFSLTVSLLLFSAYCKTPLLIGNYAMPIRLNIWIKNGLAPMDGIWFSIIVSLVSITVGYCYFNSIDIMNKE